MRQMIPTFGLALLGLGGCTGDVAEDTGASGDTSDTMETTETKETTTSTPLSGLDNITAITFDDAGTLYVGDSGTGTITALVPPDATNPDAAMGYNLRNVDTGLAEVLGTTPSNVRVKDLTVHPTTKEVYLAVGRVTGDAYASGIAIVNQAGDIRLLDPTLTGDSVDIPFAPTDEFLFYREFPSRDLSFTDLQVYNDRLIVAGMSNADFASTLWTLPLPFDGTSAVTTTEIYHAIHGQLETRAPIRTMAVMNLNGEDHLVAAYTCTPLVVFPVDDIVDGSEIRGKTIGELGYGNTPGDMVAFEASDQGGNTFEVLFVQNKNQGGQVIAKQAMEAANAGPGLTEPLLFTKEDLGAFETPMTGILQLADQDPGRLVTVRRDAEQGDLEVMSYLKNVYFRLSDFQSEYEIPGYEYPPEQDLIRQFQNTMKLEEGYPEYVNE